MSTHNSPSQPDLERASICLSDLHLESPQAPAFACLERQLRAAASAGKNIFLLGDLCEVWVGDDDDGPLARAFRELIRTAAAKVFVGLMHGNRDFLFGAQFETDSGCTLLPDPYTLGSQILLSHGDRYCTDDTEYQQLRALLRSAEWQTSVRSQTLEQRRELAAGLRLQSKAANANKAMNIMDVNADAVRQEMLEQECRILIHGHTHRPARHREAEFERVVLGDWDSVAWIAEIDPQVQRSSATLEELRAGVTLRCVPLQEH